MAEKAGQPGNTNATKDKRLVTDALRRVAVQNPEKLRKACEKVLEDAMDGNLAAFSLLSDRLDGRPAQSVTVSGDEENPLELVTKVEIVPLVNPTDTDT